MSGDGDGMGGEGDGLVVLGLLGVFKWGVFEVLVCWVCGVIMS